MQYTPIDNQIKKLLQIKPSLAQLQSVLSQLQKIQTPDNLLIAMQNQINQINQIK